MKFINFNLSRRAIFRLIAASLFQIMTTGHAWPYEASCLAVIASWFYQLWFAHFDIVLSYCFSRLQSFRRPSSVLVNIARIVLSLLEFKFKWCSITNIWEHLILPLSHSDNIIALDIYFEDLSVDIISQTPLYETWALIGQFHVFYLQKQCASPSFSNYWSGPNCMRVG